VIYDYPHASLKEYRDISSGLYMNPWPELAVVFLVIAPPTRLSNVILKISMDQDRAAEELGELMMVLMR
jgi:hypothetical protein